MKIIVSIISLSIMNFCYASQNVAQQELPSSSYFNMLPGELQVKIFEEYLLPAQTLPKLFSRVQTWIQANKEFNYFASQGLGKRNIIQQQLSIIKPIEDDLREKQFIYLAGLLDPHENKKLLPILNAQELTIAQRFAELGKIILHILAVTAAYPNNLDLMKILWVNGADINFNELIYQQPCAFGRLCYKGETPLQSAIKGAVFRRLLAFALPLPIKNEIDKLKYLLDKNANPDKASISEPESCVELLFGYWQQTYLYPYHPSGELREYALEALELLLQKKAYVSKAIIRHATTAFSKEAYRVL